MVNTSGDDDKFPNETIIYHCTVSVGSFVKTILSRNLYRQITGSHQLTDFCERIVDRVEI